MKYHILEVLKQKAPDFVSGEELSRQLGVSRTSVWKHIDELKTDGYGIAASTRKGYSLISTCEKLNSFEIRHKLGTSVVGRNVIFLTAIDSTSSYAKQIAAEGCMDGTVVAADKQTDGRGRLGRSWESPAASGIYLSVVLRPELQPEKAQLITIAASVAVAAALEAAAGIVPGIKWPNDILLGGKKVCGILTEMSSEMDRINHIILGIGINFSQKAEDFPEELRDRAVSVMDFIEVKQGTVLCSKMRGTHFRTKNRPLFDFGKLDIIRAVLKELDRVYSFVLKNESEKILKEWKKYTVTLGREIRAVSRDGELTGTAIDIRDDGRLVIRCSNGEVKDILSGEVSVRGMQGYF